tara:strand:- start:2281 stop:2559 length:279 start_codon:yes stop_codon:yes gene_type:complete
MKILTDEEKGFGVKGWMRRRGLDEKKESESCRSRLIFQYTNKCNLWGSKRKKKSMCLLFLVVVVILIITMINNVYIAIYLISKNYFVCLSCW